MQTRGTLDRHRPRGWTILPCFGLFPNHSISGQLIIVSQMIIPGVELIWYYRIWVGIGVPADKRVECFEY